MRRLTYTLLLASILFAGCRKVVPPGTDGGAAANGDAPLLLKDSTAAALLGTVRPDGTTAATSNYDSLVASFAAPTKQQQYDTALLEALDLLGKG